MQQVCSASLFHSLVVIIIIIIFALVVGSVLAYVFYWVAAIAVLVWMKFKEVRFFLTFPF